MLRSNQYVGYQQESVLSLIIRKLAGIQHLVTIRLQALIQYRQLVTLSVKLHTV